MLNSSLTMRTLGARRREKAIQTQRYCNIEGVLYHKRNKGKFLP